jgi:hypothetical protein
MDVQDNSHPENKPVPTSDGEAGFSILKGLARDRSLLTAMNAMRDHWCSIYVRLTP